MISKEEILKIARLAKLEILDESIDSIADDMQKILDYMQMLNTADTDSVMPTAHPVDIYNVYENDCERALLQNEEVFANASQHNSKFFLVPKVIDK